MFCPSCGKQIADASSFCPYCGNTTSGAPVPAAPAEQTPAPKKKKNTLLLVVGIIVAVVLILAIVIACIFNSPAMVVARAFRKTSDAYADAAKDLEMPDYTQFAEDKAYNAGMSMEFVGFKDLTGAAPGDAVAEDYAAYADPSTALIDALSGFGVRIDGAFSLSEQDASVVITPYYGSFDLLDVEAGIQGNNAFVYVEELLGDEYYGVNTTNIGQVLADNEMMDPAYKDLGFNFFEIMDQIIAAQTVDPEWEEQLIEAGKALAKSISIEKEGKQTISVNGKKTKCSVYAVQVPQSAIEDYLDVLKDYLEASQNEDLFETVLQSMHLPKDLVNEMVVSAGTPSDAYEQIFDAMEEILDEVGDPKVDLYISKGYISAAVWEFEVDGDDGSISAYLGGGENYVDDLSLVFVNEYQTAVITSSGNHSGKDGTYTDTLTVEVGEDEDDVEAVLTVESSYSPKDESNNLSVSMDIDQVGSVSMEGTLIMEDNLFRMEMDEVAAVIEDEAKVTFAMSYYVSGYERLITAADPIMLLEMDQAQQLDFTMTLMTNIQNLTTELEGVLPEGLMDAIMYM